MTNSGTYRKRDSEIQINVSANVKELPCYKQIGFCCSHGLNFKEMLINIQQLIDYRNSLELSEIDIDSSIVEYLTNYWKVKPIKDKKYQTIGYYHECECGFYIPINKKFQMDINVETLFKIWMDEHSKEER